MKKRYQIAIDGPAGSGKSTIARLLAKELKYLYIDSGAMYRACTLFLIENGLINKSETEIEKKIKKVKIIFKNLNNEQRVYLNNKNVTKEIRLHEITKKVSFVSAIGGIRKEMVKRQKEFGANSSIIMDGRDIGIAVFKDADLKIYLTATAEVRAERRKKDLKKLNENTDMETLIQDIQIRDHLDSSRNISPLTKAQDAIVIDSSNLKVNEVLERIKSLLPS